MNITCFIPYSGDEYTEATCKVLLDSGEVKKVFVLGQTDRGYAPEDERIEVLTAGQLVATATLRQIAGRVNTSYVLLYTKPMPLDTGYLALHRMKSVCNDIGASMVYSDYYELREGKLLPHPVIDYQEGSLRDDFSFGSLLFFRSDAFLEAITAMDNDYEYAGLYDLRLKISQKGMIIHIPEFLYTEIETDTRKSGEKQFDYVNPSNRAVQIEMEKVCTDHLKKSGAWLKPEFSEVSFGGYNFDCEASVIIPVRNRIKTIGDAIESVLSQKASFKFNLIIVDNHSTDGTTDLIKSHALTDSRIVHIIPGRRDLGIGGCWNTGVFHDECGKFAIQLDSDDLYIDNNVLQRIVDAFYAQKCAMVIGSYRIVNFELNEIPPGLIDHREWTPDNGRNNALRINGLGAPRAFFTPVLRSVALPNVSYGEDYAAGLAISRYYRIGRIYEPLYLCRRWDDNSDASLDINRINAYNLYKDRIRTIEFLARKKMVSEKSGL